MQRSSTPALLASVLCALVGCTDASSPAGPRTDDAATPATDGGPVPGDAVTYHGHARPILARHCEGCHVEGGIAPFPLDTYEVASAFSMRIAEVTRSRTMPPYPANASGECNTFRDARWLTEGEIATLEAWHAQGAPEGDPSTPAPDRMSPPTLDPSEVTAEAGLAAPYTPERTTDDTPQDEIRCFVVDPGLATNAFLTAYEVVPGAPSVVHHVILYEPDSAAAASMAQERDDADPAPGYACNGGPTVQSHPVVLWAPGGGALRFPEGTGLALAPHPMVLQIHYNIAAGAVPDQTRVRLVTAPSVTQQARILSLSDAAALQLPPRSTDAHATASWTAPADGVVHGVFPHMHQRGRTLRVTRTAGGAESCMLDVDRWDFNWQLGYFYESPIRVQRGDLIELDCGFDTTAETSMVTWGEGSGDEMCLNYFYVTGR
jgi:hypothetical protein